MRILKLLIVILVATASLAAVSAQQVDDLEGQKATQQSEPVSMLNGEEPAPESPQVPTSQREGSCTPKLSSETTWDEALARLRRLEGMRRNPRIMRRPNDRRYVSSQIAKLRAQLPKLFAEAKAHGDNVAREALRKAKLYTDQKVNELKVEADKTKEDLLAGRQAYDALQFDEKGQSKVLKELKAASQVPAKSNNPSAEKDVALQEEVDVLKTNVLALWIISGTLVVLFVLALIAVRRRTA